MQHKDAELSNMICYLETNNLPDDDLNAIKRYLIIQYHFSCQRLHTGSRSNKLFDQRMFLYLLLAILHLQIIFALHYKALMNIIQKLLHGNLLVTIKLIT